MRQLLDEPMTDIELALNSAKKCTEGMIGEDLGTGVNAGLGADTEFITSSPLSELVWSQHTGLTLKYAAPSLAEKKASVLWNTETFNITISSPQRTNVGANNNTDSSIAGALNSLQLKPNTEHYDYSRVTFLGSPSSTLGMKPVPSLRIHEQGQESFGGKELSNGKGKRILLDKKQEHDQVDKEEVKIDSPRNRSQIAGRSEAAAFDINYGKPSMPDNAKDGTWQASYKDKSSPIRCEADCNVKSSNMRKSKEHVLSDVGDSWSISNEREGSHETVESSNSKRLTSSGKRASSPDSKISGRCKMVKRQRNENSCSGSSVRQSSSFMNWIAAITNGYMSSDQAKPLSFVPQPSPITERHLSSIPKSNENAGFRSLFQTLYMGIDRQRDASKEQKVARGQFVHGSRMLCDNVELDSCNVIPATNERMYNGSEEHVSSGSARLVHYGNCAKSHNRDSTSGEKLNQVTRQVEELPSTTIKISSTNSSQFHEKTKCKIGKTCKTSDMGSPSSCPKISSGPHSKDKGIGMLVSVPNSSSSLVANGSFLGSQWIKRLSSKVSTDRANTSPCNQSMELANERLTSTCNTLHPNIVASNKGQSNSGNYYLPSLQGEKDAVSGEKHEGPVFPNNSCGSKRTDDQKLQSKLNPILPSDRFKKSGQMASVFAKRLDAFRHITPSEVSKIATSSTTTCFFCGKSGHTIMECSEIGETDLSGLLKNMNSYYGTDKSSCLCIRCFQLNHWAISCPNSSSKKNHFIENPFVVGNENCNRIKNKRGDPSSANHEGRTIFSAEGKQAQHQLTSLHKIPRIGNVRDGTTEVVVTSNVSTGMGRVVAPNTKNICSYQVKEDIGESMVKINPAASSSGENELKENQIISFRNFIPTELTEESVGIFETIRRLRLSRTDITRWMNSPISHFSLEGFFLRLRFGKWEKDMAGTGYHVACINGATGENCISICIGGFIYLVDFHSVSNHDFIEDELKAWWFETLKGGCKRPVIEELNKKLAQRIEFGF